MWGDHGLGEELYPPKGYAEFLWEVGGRLLRPVSLVDWRGVDKWRNSHRLAGSRDVFAVEKGAGPVFDRLHIGDLWIPATLAAVKANAAASG